MVKLFFIIGIISTVVSGIFSESLNDGRNGAIFYSKTVKDVDIKMKFGIIFCLIGLIAFLASGLIYFQISK